MTLYFRIRSRLFTVFLVLFWQPIPPDLLHPLPDLTLITVNADGSTPDFALLIDWLRLQRADVVLMQEKPRLHGNLLVTLAEMYPYQLEQASPRGYRGMVVLSRYPIVESRYADLPNAPFLRVVIELKGERVALYNVSLMPPILGNPSDVISLIQSYNTSIRDGELRALLAEVAQEPYPAVVAGDFNLLEFDPIYAELTQLLTDAGGGGGTFSLAGREALAAAQTGLIRIDYIFFSSDHWRQLEITLGGYVGSDHLPLRGAFTRVFP